MKRMYTVVGLILLAGCQSDVSVRSGPPLDRFPSTRSADAAVECLIPALASNYKAISPQRFIAQTLAPGKEYDIVPTDARYAGHYTYTINVKSTGSGSMLSIYKGQMMLPSITESIRVGVKACL